MIQYTIPEAKLYNVASNGTLDQASVEFLAGNAAYNNHLLAGIQIVVIDHKATTGIDVRLPIFSHTHPFTPHPPPLQRVFVHGE